MNVFDIDGHLVNSSFDRGFTETLLRSFLAMAQAFELPGFDKLPEPEQEKIVEKYYQKSLPPPHLEKEKGWHLKEPILFTLESGENIVINASEGQWFVLLEKEMLRFHPTR